MRLDGMNAVAVSADRGHAIAARDGLPVDALVEGLRNVGVAFSAGGWNIEFVDRRLGVIGRKDVMSAMTVCADGGLGRTVLRGTAVNALLVGDESLSAFAIRLHQEFLAVASAAGVRNVGVIDRRVRGSAGYHLVGAAVTVLAIRGYPAPRHNLGMRAVGIGVLRVGMAIGTENLLGRRFVRQALDVLMAIHASELHGGVDGMLQFFRVDIERDRLAIEVGGERRVAVATEAVFVFQFVLGASGEGRAQQKERGRTEQYSAGDFHAIEETLMELCAP